MKTRSIAGLTASAAVAAVAAYALLQPPPQHVVSSYFDLATMDGIPGDGFPDNRAVQAAIDAAEADGGEVIVDGLYEIRSRAADPGLGNPWRIFGVVITANEEDVRITCRGGGGFRAVGSMHTGAFYMVTVYKNIAPVFFQGCRFDMSGRTDGFEEQQHALELDIGAKHVRITDSVFFHPQLAPNGGGDCIRMLGGYTEAELVEDVAITRVVYLGCDRSELGMQRGINGVTIEHLFVLGGLDNNLDQEATGVLPESEDPNGYSRIRNVNARSVFIIRNGGTAVTLGRGWNMRLTESTIHGAGVYLLSCRACFVTNSTIIGDGTVNSPVAIRRDSEGVKILGNWISALTPGGAGSPLVYVVADADGAPRDVEIANNTLKQTVSQVAVMIRATRGAAVHDNSIVYAGPEPVNSNAVGVVYESIHANQLSGTIQNNRFRGPWYAAANVSPHPTATPPRPVGPVSFTGNQLDGPARGLRCMGYATTPALFVGIVSNGNTPIPGAANECPIATTGI